MPIPALLAGLLPAGIHECTIDEIVAQFGAFQESDQRPRLARELTSYVAELRAAGVAKYLIVDGSFITSKARPGDIDLLLVLRDDVDLQQSVPPYRFNPRSSSYVRGNYNFDFYVGFEGDPTAEQIFALFRDVKYQPGAVKGLLKVVL